MYKKRRSRKEIERETKQIVAWDTQEHGSKEEKF